MNSDFWGRNDYFSLQHALAVLCRTLEEILPTTRDHARTNNAHITAELYCWQHVSMDGELLTLITISLYQSLRRHLFKWFKCFSLPTHYNQNIKVILRSLPWRLNRVRLACGRNTTRYTYMATDIQTYTYTQAQSWRWRSDNINPNCHVCDLIIEPIHSRLAGSMWRRRRLTACDQPPAISAHSLTPAIEWHT